ncbi:MAG TPA: peptide-methionine (S)-S-oxide reductase, partial [Beutenbergiaceae bacterium]|nr:peptide-methionine (S)-S-oxide reductase [Beutenbergiaceae bacterium]
MPHLATEQPHYAFPLPTTHAVFGTPLQGPWPKTMKQLTIGMGCFWGAERIFWQLPGVV